MTDITISDLKVEFLISYIKDSRFSNGYPVDYFIDKEAQLLQYYIDDPKLSCCHISGGYHFTIDGIEWEGYDEIHMSLCFPNAVNELIRGKEKRHFAGIWEESALYIENYNESLFFMQEERPGPYPEGFGVPIYVEKQKLIPQIISETKRFVELSDRLQKTYAIQPYPEKEDVLYENLFIGGHFERMINELEEINSTSQY